MAAVRCTSDIQAGTQHAVAEIKGQIKCLVSTIFEDFDSQELDEHIDAVKIESVLGELEHNSQND